VSHASVSEDVMGLREVAHLDDLKETTDRDGVAALRDTAAEAGDENAVEDLFSLDLVEARELGVNLDVINDEPPLT
jgi:hypothetical protein